MARRHFRLSFRSTALASLLAFGALCGALSACGGADEPGQSLPWLEAAGGSAATGGVLLPLGGYYPAGGYYPMTGGTYPETGGYFPETGGTYPETGGTYPETGGYFPVTGGTNPGGTGGYPETGGTGGDVSGGSAGTPPVDPCPVAVPRTGAACSEIGVTCTYPDCCGTLGTRVVYCSGTLGWLIDESQSERCGTCPDALPEADTACAPFTCDTLEGVRAECAYTDTACGRFDIARCQGGVWQNTYACSTP